MKRTFLFCLFLAQALLADTELNFTPPEAMPQGQTIPEGYNLGGSIQLKKSWDLFITADFLYLYVSQDNLDLGKQTLTAASSQTLEDNFSVNFEYKPGFSVGIGKRFSYDEWNILFQYTRLHFSVSNAFFGPQNSTFQPYWLSAVIYPTSAVTEMKGSWRFKDDIFSLFLFRPFYVGQKLLLSPNLGIEGFVLDQRFNAEYGNQGSSQTKSSSWAVGPSFYLDLGWLLNCDFRVLGQIKGSAYYQHFNVKNIQQFIPSISTATLTMKKTIQTVSPALEVSGGLGWGSYFYKNRWHIDFSAKYLMAVLWNQNQMRRAMDSTSAALDRTATANGDLISHGLNVGMRLDF